ncbi:MAG: gliding motility-associated C-terminal domain-containing protein [Bacteroidetes bacterium]|nr:gliding motility-associated C-terminal domain-containing protein [Bacteroidota bacterium]
MNRVKGWLGGLLACAFQLHGQGLYFTPNAGQWDEPVVARTVFAGGSFFLRKDGFRVKLYNPADLPKIHKAFHNRYTDSEYIIHGHTLDVSFKDCQPAEKIGVSFEEEAPYYENYYLGDNPTQWKTEVYPVSRVRLKSVYPGIDFVIYTKGEKVEYDWVLQPGANPDLIRLFIQGENGLVFKGEDIHILSSVGDFVMKQPHGKQGNQPIPFRFRKAENPHILQFYCPEGIIWNQTQPLIIDPVLVFSTYSGSRGDNFGFTATYDTGGCLYAGGIVDNAQGIYPVTVGAFQTTYGGRGPAQAPVYLPCDVAISKYKPNGSGLIYATYLGGKSNEYPHSLGLDEKNNLLVLGTTLSSDFPIPKTTAYDTGYNGNHDLYVVKLSADGKQMLAGTYLGGPADDGINTGLLHFNYADDFRGDIVCDKYGNIFIATCSRSAAFPVTARAPQKSLKGALEAVAVSLNSNLSALRWSTFMGGTSDDAAYSVRLDDSLNVFIGGGTASTGFPVPAGGYISAHQGGRADGFVMKLNYDSGFFKAGSFWGTSDYDQVYFLDFDNEQKIYITGQTEGSVNRTAGTYGKNGTTQFIARLLNDLSGEDMATTFGNRTTNPELSPCAFMVDKCYNIYFSGWGAAVGVGNAGTTNGLQVSSNAFQPVTDDNDFYLIVLSRDAKSLLYATFFGGDSSEDHVDGGTSRFDKRGVIYQSVCSSCPNSPPGLNDFPTTSGAAFPINVSYRCSNASFKLDFKITYAVEAKFDVVPRKVCMPAPMNFFQQNAITAGKRFEWIFGDGNTSNLPNPVHTYTTAGKYTVKLRVLDTASCNKADSMTLDVEALAGPDGSLTVNTDLCDSKVKMQLSGSGFDTAQWILGDGIVAFGKKVEHTYAPGKYDIKVYLVNNSSGCRDTLGKSITINTDSLSQIYLANIFTPNADAWNECYRVYGLSKACDGGELKIFNRWGERVFYTDDLAQCWNGRVDNTGLEVPEGTYFYQVIQKGKGSAKNKVISGSINLIR